MLDASNFTTTLEPTSQPGAIATVGRKDRTHLRVVSINIGEKYIVVDVYASELRHSSCYLHSHPLRGYEVKHTVRHPSETAYVDVRETVYRLLSPKRFNTLLGAQKSTRPIDILRCGVAVGGCTFFMREYADGSIVAVFDDGRRQTQSPATVDDWNSLIDVWDAEEAGYGDARRVRIAQRFFAARGWMQEGVLIFGHETRGNL